MSHLKPNSQSIIVWQQPDISIFSNSRRQCTLGGSRKRKKMNTKSSCLDGFGFGFAFSIANVFSNSSSSVLLSLAIFILSLVLSWVAVMISVFMQLIKSSFNCLFSCFVVEKKMFVVLFRRSIGIMEYIHFFFFSLWHTAKAQKMQTKANGEKKLSTVQFNNKNYISLVCWLDLICLH